MKYLPVLILSLFLASCANSTTEKPEDNNQKRNFLWTAEWTNVVQENPEDITNTVYTFLTKTGNKNAVRKKEKLTNNSGSTISRLKNQYGPCKRTKPKF
jgi:hypothetical protein